ncbi:MAG TPA: cyclopropane-fatty-acyl-phospholipid synthase family protein [Opitutaceae bacterium]|nr:cyclopropane-fatty-acyl-phospholipid synthase family protein [Opitutaceae bacterium]
MKTATDAEVETSLQFLAELFENSPLSQVAVQLWEGTLWPDHAPRAATLVLNHPGALRAMFNAGTEMGLAEAYLHDDFDVVGDMEAAFEIADVLGKGLGWKRSLALMSLLRKLPGGERRGSAREFIGRLGRRHSPARDRNAISFHYDVSSDFYRLWLDRQMVYSCAYFEEPGNDLDTAQTAKLDHICRKLRLKPGQRLLDIGCGWGGLVLHAARHYGVDATGITLSEKQAELATARAAEAGLSQRVHIYLRDYRDLDEGMPFDVIVSVGMSEHVGAENLPTYFRKAHAVLKPGGVFLNHAIGEGARHRPTEGPSFIDEYVFPDSEIPPVQTVLVSAASAGFEIRDVENLREHYALTLRHWVHRLEARHEEALAYVSEETYRVWRLYMAGSAHGFAHGRLAIYQALLAKPDETGNARVPLTRRDWYGRGG